MPATLSPTQHADLRHHQDDVSLVPKDPPAEDALEALSKLARRATAEPASAPATSGRLFASPRMTEPSADPGARPVDLDEALGRAPPSANDSSAALSGSSLQFLSASPARLSGNPTATRPSR